MRILRYSLLAEAAYKDARIWDAKLPGNCPYGMPSQMKSQIRIWPIWDWVLEDARDAMYYKADVYRKPISAISFYTGGTGKYVSCTRREQNPLFRLAMNIRLLADNDTIAFAPKVILIVADQLLPDKEMLGIVELEQDDGEKVFGIQGTQVDEKLRHIVSQLETSIEGLMEDSCLFDFAYEVAERFFVRSIVGEYGKFDYFSVVGHSLGGAVAQHIGRHKDFQTTIRRTINQNSVFGVYAFNSLGLSDVQYRYPYYRRIYSVQVSGELLDHWNEKYRVGMEQIGNVLVYGEDLPGSVSIGERRSRHGIARVQKEICRCLAGKGTFAYE